MKKAFSAVIAAALTVLLFLFPSSAANGALHGINICKDALLPSLFPFLIISCFISLCGACEYISVLFLPAVRLLKLTDKTASIWLSAFIGGFPSGAHSVCSLYQLVMLKKENAERLISCCVCSGPAFLILVIGRQMLGSLHIGIILYAAQIVSVILLTAVFCRFEKATDRIFENHKYLPFDSSLVMAVSNSCNSVINIFAFVIFFSIITELLKDSAPMSAFILPFLEVTIGCEQASLLEGSLSLILIAFLTGFGGFSVCFQILSIADNVGLSPALFWRTRILNGILCAAVSSILLKIFPPTVSVFSSSVSPSVAVLSVDRFLGGICLAAMLLLSMQRLDFNIKN